MYYEIMLIKSFVQIKRKNFSNTNRAVNVTFNDNITVGTGLLNVTELDHKVLSLIYPAMSYLLFFFCSCV